MSQKGFEVKVKFNADNKHKKDICLIKQNYEKTHRLVFDLWLILDLNEDKKQKKE